VIEDVSEFGAWGLDLKIARSELARFLNPSVVRQQYIVRALACSSWE